MSLNAPSSVPVHIPGELVDVASASAERLVALAASAPAAGTPEQQIEALVRVQAEAQALIRVQRSVILARRLESS